MVSNLSHHKTFKVVLKKWALLKLVVIKVSEKTGTEDFFARFQANVLTLILLIFLVK